jgi:hypothetical protein
MTLIGRDGNTEPDKRPDNATGDGHVTALSLSPGAAGIFIVLYSITTLLAIIGNVLTIVVFTKGKKCRTDIRPFLLNLAIADLIMAFRYCPYYTNHNSVSLRNYSGLQRECHGIKPIYTNGSICKNTGCDGR